MASESPSSLGFGLVGLGLIADFHARAIADTPGCKLVGVCGRTLEKARAFAAKHHAGFATASLDELLARPDIQVVCIATPSGAHLEPAIAAARAGKHIVVEKPLEVTHARSEELLRATAAAGVRVLPIFQARFGPGATQVKSALSSGRLGRLVLASAYVKWHRSEAYYRDSWHGTQALDGGGALMNQGIHAVDLLQWFAGMPRDVFGWITRRVHTGIEVEDTATAVLRFPDGGQGVIEATTATYPGWARRIEICGEKGSIALEDDFIAKWDFKESRPEDAAILASRPDPTLRSGAGAPANMSHRGHQLQIQSMADAIRQGTPLLLDGPEARKAVTLILAIYESARRGLPVTL